MAIRFRCSSCKRRLSVGDHKAGQRVRCPNCRSAVTVPTQAELATAAAMAGEVPHPAAEPPPFKTVEARTTSAAPIIRQPAAATSATVEKPDPSFDPTAVSVSRRVLYAQGGLMAVTAIAAFALGYLFGGSSAARPTPPANPTILTGPIEVGGVLTYTHNREPRTDAGAVIIFLPHDSSPDEKIPVAGLRPQDSPPGEGAMPVRAIRSLGGEYRRSDRSGAFSLTLPRAGKYHVLLVSKGARQPSSEEPCPEDLAALGYFFKSARELVQGQKYHWQTLELRQGTDLTHDFGPRGP